MSGPPRPNKALEPMSRALSSLLRHNATKEGVKISDDGWVSSDDALKWLATKKRITADESMLRAVVEQSDKQRFSLRRTAEGHLAIRANQGHSMTSISIEMSELGDSVTRAVHGTYLAAWPSIQAAGLSKMGRQHVHLARDLPGESGVISGMRKSCEVLVWVDVTRARAAGMVFYESENGVVLTDGFGGAVPPRFFDRVEERATGRLMWRPPAESAAAAEGSSGAAEGDDSGDAPGSAKRRKVRPDRAPCPTKPCLSHWDR